MTTEDQHNVLIIYCQAIQIQCETHIQNSSQEDILLKVNKLHNRSRLAVLSTFSEKDLLDNTLTKVSFLSMQLQGEKQHF